MYFGIKKLNSHNFLNNLLFSMKHIMNPNKGSGNEKLCLEENTLEIFIVQIDLRVKPFGKNSGGIL